MSEQNDVLKQVKDLLEPLSQETKIEIVESLYEEIVIDR